ncbi:MAG: hypothetical protein VR64_16255 [Desulfatitalea sp. BRH_c12]|nr:MAG: hypothetical protein VR64_16255 [Desulfatitalea sp. BRH_c12]
MSKPFSSTVIGLFVISAIGLLVAGVLVFGSGGFFKEKRNFVLFFEGSVKGLQVGAPVVFRGVEIGTVKEIIMRADLDTLDITIPVIIEIDRERFGISGNDKDRRVNIRKLIEKGFRGQLGMQSMVTGQLMIEFDFLPGTPVRLVNADLGYTELPTLPSKLEQLADTIAELPIRKLFVTLNEAVEGVEKIMNAPEVKATLVSLKSAAQGADRLMHHAGDLVARTDKQIDPTVKSLRTVADDASSLLKNVDGELVSVAAKIEKVSDAATLAMKQGQATLKSIQGIAGDDSEMVYRLADALKELSVASRSVRLLAEQLEQYPDSIIRGKSAAGGE